LLDENTGTEGTPVWTNRLTIALATGLPTLAAATDPSDAKDLTRKGYVDAQITAHTGAGTAHAGATNLIHATGAETLAGVKTFSSIPVLPATNPTADNEAVRKAYADSLAYSGTPEVILAHVEPSGTDGGGQSSGSWSTRTLNTEKVDTDNVCTLSGNQFTLQSGTYDIEVLAVFHSCNGSKIRLWNVSDSGVQADINSNDIYSTNFSAPAAASGCCVIRSRFTLASSKTLRIEGRLTLSNASQGWGVACSFSAEEVYMLVCLKKVS